MQKKKTTKFAVRLDGINLPMKAQQQIADAIRKTVRRELATIDLKGELVETKSVESNFDDLRKSGTLGYHATLNNVTKAIDL